MAAIIGATLGSISVIGRLKKYHPIMASFCLFSSFPYYNSITNWKKHRCCALDSNRGPKVRLIIVTDESTEQSMLPKLWRDFYLGR